MLAYPSKSARPLPQLRSEILAACLKTSVVSDSDIPLSFFYVPPKRPTGAAGSVGGASRSAGKHHALLSEPVDPAEHAAWALQSLDLSGGARLSSKYLRKVSLGSSIAVATIPHVLA